MTKALLEELQFSLGQSVVAILPELVLCGTIVLMLLLRLFKHMDDRHLGVVAFVFCVYAGVIAFQQWMGHDQYDPRGEARGAMSLFNGKLVHDNFGVFVKLFLLGFTALVILLNVMTRIPDREDSADYMTLLLGATLGMMLMATANHLIMVFIAVEMASLPSYALAGFMKGRRQSSEAALKYVVYGGGAAGIMLFGMSLLAGKYGTGYMPDLLAFIAGQHSLDAITLLGLLFILIGIAFKLAAVPFHFWCPDVFEGAAAEVGAFLSVASKGAALALLARITMGLGGLTAGMAGLSGEDLPPPFPNWAIMTSYLVPIIAVFAALTTTFGNLAAFGQTNLKRLLAYSTIAHAGFMMMGLAAMNKEGVGAVLFYLVVYLFMNLGAFAVVAFLRNFTGSEDLTHMRGLVHRAPVLVIALGFFLLSLLGLPPLAGFAAKFQIFTVLYDSADEFRRFGLNSQAITLYALLIIAGINTVLSLFYYVKVLKVMILDKSLEEVEGRAQQPVPPAPLPNGYVGVLAFVVLAIGVYWGWLFAGISDGGIEPFRDTPQPPAVVQVKGER
jgi:NADH-quinone oxidoreductase subunit N